MIFNVDDLKSDTVKIKPKKYDNNIPEDVPLEKVVMFRELPYDDKSEFFNSEKFPLGLVFYDFEVFKKDWMVVLIEPLLHKKTIIVNDVSILKLFFNGHKSNIWVGYNNLNFDAPI